MFNQQQKLAAGQRIPDRLRDLRLSEARTRAQAEGAAPESFTSGKVINIAAPIGTAGLSINIADSITQTTFGRPAERYEHSMTVIREERRQPEEVPKKSCWSCFGC